MRSGCTFKGKRVLSEAHKSPLSQYIEGREEESTWLEEEIYGPIARKCTGETPLWPYHLWRCQLHHHHHPPNTWITEVWVASLLQSRALFTEVHRDGLWTECTNRWWRWAAFTSSSSMIASARNFVAYYFLAITVYTLCSLPHFPNYNQFATKIAGQEDFCVSIWLTLHLFLLVFCILNTGFTLYFFFWLLLFFFLQK